MIDIKKFGSDLIKNVKKSYYQNHILQLKKLMIIV